MVRTLLALLMGAVLLVAGATRADEAPGGNWKVNILNPDGPETMWLVKLANADGKWTGSVADVAEGMPKFTVEGLSVADGRMRFTLASAKQSFSFDGKMPKEGAKIIKGSIASEGQMVPSELEATTVSSLKRFDVAKDILLNHADDSRVFNAAMAVLSDAGNQKAKPEDVRGWAEKLWKAAEPYGVRWQMEMEARTADILSQEKDYATIALAYAQRTERMLEPKDSARTKQRVLKSLAGALEKAGKADEAKEVQGRIAKLDKEVKAEQVKLEAQADEDYLKKMPPFKAETFAGRKGKSTRAVLVELFTGTQCPPCVAADLAFDGLTKTYKTADVVLLQYHVHVPGPDPLANLDTDARMDYYSEEVEGTPALLLNGKIGYGQGGGVEDSEKVYGEFRKRIEPLLEKEAQAALEISATRRGNKIEINAEAAEVATPGDTIRLRFVLVEETQRYVGTNGIRFHHHVVRAMPGGDKGFPIKDKKVRQSVSVDLADLRKQLTQYMAAIAKKTRAKFPEPEEVLDLKNLRVVAFVQNDKTKEVLQAKEVEVGGGKD